MNKITQKHVSNVSKKRAFDNTADEAERRRTG